jgi:hypothetical protein
MLFNDFQPIEHLVIVDIVVVFAFEVEERYVVAASWDSIVRRRLM